VTQPGAYSLTRPYLFDTPVHVPWSGLSGSTHTCQEKDLC